MRVLLITQILPYPPDAGPRIKTWHVLRYLVQKGHEVILCSFVRPEEEVHLEKMRGICKEVHPVPIRRSRVADAYYMMRSFFTGRPFLVERDDLPAMRKKIGSLLQENNIDVIHADQLSMAQFAFPKKLPFPGSWRFKKRAEGPKIVFDAHNAVWNLVERMVGTIPAFLKPILTIEKKRVKRYEGLLVVQVDRLFAVSEIDKEMLLEAAASIGITDKRQNRISVIPIAVDIPDLSSTQRNPQSRNILTLGTLHYPPNADGIRWFVQEVFPLITEKIPPVTLTIVGKNPPDDFFQFTDQFDGKITVTGYVPDLKPYLDQAVLMVVPVRVGGGMRVRILEAFARGIPLVTTTVGLEGIDAEPGKHILVEDDPPAFAQAVVELMQNPEKQADLIRNGRELVKERYDWQTALEKMDEVY